MLLLAVVPQAAAARDWLDTVVGIATALNTLLLFVILLVIAPAFWAFIRNMRQLRALLDRLYDDLKPLTNHANRIAANVDEITDAVRTEVTHFTQSIAQANEGISRAIESTDRRLSKLGALMDVAQQEAEKLLVSTAAAVEGVRAGARSATNDNLNDNRADGADEPQERPSRPRVRSRRKRSD